MDTSLQEFWDSHAAGGPPNVVLAIAVDPGQRWERIGVFSTIANAQAWGDRLRQEKATPVNLVYAAYVIDVPEYGNVPEGERQ